MTHSNYCNYCLPPLSSPPPGGGEATKCEMEKELTIAFYLLRLLTYKCFQLFLHRSEYHMKWSVLDSSFFFVVAVWENIGPTVKSMLYLDQSNKKLIRVIFLGVFKLITAF